MKLLSFSALASLSLLYPASLCAAQDAAPDAAPEVTPEVAPEVTPEVTPEAETTTARPPQRSNVKGFGPDLTGVDPALIVYPPKGIDYPGCFKDLVFADSDGNGKVTNNEYLSFVQEYGKRKCYEADSLSLPQHAAFSSIACMCEQIEGHDPGCCLSTNAQIPTAGALNPTGRTEEERFYLNAACRITDGTIDSSCPPYIKERTTPPPVVAVPVDVATQAVDEGMNDPTKWGLIAAAIVLGLLLLLCCVCCCVIRRKRAKQMEEEQEVVDNTPGKEAYDEESPEQAGPRAIPAVPPTVMDDGDSNEGAAKNRQGGQPDEDSYDGDGRKRNAGNDDDSEEGGDGRRKRGSNYVPDEDEALKRKWPNGELPPQQNRNENIQLRPIPDKVPEEDPDWDQPGYNMDNAKVKDDDSVQEFERYQPDGGVPVDDRQPKDPVTYKRDWNRGKAPEEDENENRKHRIQSGLGEGEIWNKLDNADDQTKSQATAQGGDVFDWVVSSALGALDTTDQNGMMDDTVHNT